MGVLTVIAGMAGSGKSSLMECFHRAYGPDAIFIGQKNIGISLRSTPATYLEIADPIRKLFGTANHVSMKKFTFNGEGACPACGGKGIIVSEMAFMENIVTTCDLCKGTRYSQETLAYRYRGRGIDQVMGMSVDEAAADSSTAGFPRRS